MAWKIKGLAREGFEPLVALDDEAFAHGCFLAEIVRD
jgi:hypothetical protein